MIGETIKRYKILDELGRGGMAVVYRAEDTALERQVAVKILHPHLASRPESSARFFREAKAVARLRHDSIVEIFDFSGTDDEKHKLIVTEYIDGGTLREFVEEHPSEIPELGILIAVPLLHALDHAHGAGVIHRDIKPENCMIALDGRVKLMDFGIAQVLEADRMTASGSLLGSPAHMPPEAIDGRPSGVPGDIFSIGTVLYFLATNTLPFIGNTPTQVLRNIIDGRYIPPSQANPKVGRTLEKLIQRCLNPDPEKRFPNVEALHKAVLEALSEVGFDDPETLAKSYVIDPARTNLEVRDLVVETLCQNAADAVANGDVASAINDLNRVFGYDPAHEGANAVLAKIESSRRLRIVAIGIAAMLLVGGLLWAGSAFVDAADESASGEISGGEVDETEDVEDVGTGENLANGFVASAAAAGLVRHVETGAEVGILRVLKAGVRRDADRVRAEKAFVQGMVQTTVAGVSLAPEPAPLHVSAIHVSPVRGKARDPREARDPDKDTEGSVTEEGTTLEGSTEAVKPEEVKPKTALVTVGVWPPDAYAMVDGRTFAANTESQNVSFPLGIGEHRVKFGCASRCLELTRTIKVGKADIEGTAPKISLDQTVVLPWKNGRLTIRSDSADGTYFYFGERGGKIRAGVVNESMVIDGFKTLGTEVEILVYAVPGGNRIRGELSSDSLAKYLFDTATIGPGERAVVTYRP